MTNLIYRISGEHGGHWIDNHRGEVGDYVPGIQAEALYVAASPEQAKLLATRDRFGVHRVEKKWKSPKNAQIGRWSEIIPLS